MQAIPGVCQTVPEVFRIRCIGQNPLQIRNFLFGGGFFAFCGGAKGAVGQVSGGGMLDGVVQIGFPAIQTLLLMVRRY